MGLSEKEAFLKKASTKEKHKYQAMDPVKKAKLLDKHNLADKKAKARKNPLLHDLDDYITKFHNKTKEGPYYTCSVCNQLLYRKSVQLLKSNKYINSNERLFTNITSFYQNEYICKTCHSKVLKGKIPCQAICNNMYVDKIPPELASLEKLEQMLIAQQIVFEKIMLKGQQKKSREQSAIYLLNVMKHVWFYHGHQKDQV